jgi:hypothetical protein
MLQVYKIVLLDFFKDNICLQEAGSLSISIFSSSEVCIKTLMMMHFLWINVEAVATRIKGIVSRDGSWGKGLEW